LVAGRSGIGPISIFDASNQFLRIAGEIKDFNFSDYVDTKLKAKRMGRHTQFAVAATRMALDDASLSREMLLDAGSVPICVGVSTCAMDLIEGGMHRLFDFGPERFSPYIVSYALPHGITHTLTEYLDINSDGQTISSACQSGAEAILHCYNLIRSGKARVAIAGGSDAPLTPFTVAAFCAGGLRPDSYDENRPESASRPFDLHRTGGILAEGAGVVVMENLDYARMRGATPYAEICGMSSSSDDAGSEPTSGLEKTMAESLYNAGVFPEQIDHICAHGPSEPVMDYVETKAIKKVFGKHAYNVPVSSIKGVTGNALAAQGPMQVVSSALTIRHQTIVPTANLDTPDPKCDLDYVPSGARRARVKRIMVNTHGLGGGNTSMVLGSVDSP
jgi:3-oxoacyl-[acyl-carrier-protein] synthase II